MLPSGAICRCATSAQRLPAPGAFRVVKKYHSAHGELLSSCWSLERNYFFLLESQQLLSNYPYTKWYFLQHRMPRGRVVAVNLHSECRRSRHVAQKILEKLLKKESEDMENAAGTGSCNPRIVYDRIIKTL